LADLWLAKGEYAQAVALYEKADLTDPIAQAQYARALTYTDPAKAVEYWASVRPADVLDQASMVGLDGMELEKRPLPLLRTSRKVVTGLEAAGTTNAANVAVTKPKKSHEAVLRRRARQREAYLAELEKRGLKHTTHPDPERWLPKYERSYNRRRRGKGGGVHKGAQGGISDKDAARLDVAARQAARAAGEPASSSSTAHIAAVSSGGPSRKGGRRRSTQDMGNPKMSNIIVH
jgi:signal recognition particle subunit SRP72